jgi:heat-inducible transcriptional repressor
MERTSQVLARISHSVGLALGRSLEEKLLEHIKFVKLSERRVLAVVVSNPDLVENRVVRIDEDIAQDELDRTADYMNAEFRGWSLATIRLEILKRIEAMKALCDRLLSNVAKLLVWGALANEESCPLFVDGAAAILDHPEFEDAQKLRDLLQTLAEKTKLVKILNGCLDSPGRGVKIMIGRENPSSEMYDCALIMAPVFYRSRVAGALGIVGPRRMQYDRAVRAVTYVSDVCARLLNAN